VTVGRPWRITVPGGWGIDFSVVAENANTVSEGGVCDCTDPGVDPEAVNNSVMSTLAPIISSLSITVVDRPVSAAAEVDHPIC
jgi:hypothetical protein